MQPVKIALDSGAWLRAVREVAGSSAAEMVVLRVDALGGTVTLREEEADSGYKVTLPAKAAGKPAVAVCCAVSPEKLLPMVKTFAGAQGDVQVVVSKVTLLFKHGKKQVLLPNRVGPVVSASAAPHAANGAAFYP